MFYLIIHYALYKMLQRSYNSKQCFFRSFTNNNKEMFLIINLPIFHLV